MYLHVCIDMFDIVPLESFDFIVCVASIGWSPIEEVS